MFQTNVNLEQLIRDSERLEAVRDYVKSEKYISKEILMSLLGVEVASNAD